MAQLIAAWLFYVLRFRSRPNSVLCCVQRFQKGAIPDDIPEITIPVDKDGDGVPIGSLLKDAELVKSTSEAFRMIKQNAVKENGERITDIRYIVQSPRTSVFQVGKRKFARVKVVSSVSDE